MSGIGIVESRADESSTRICDRLRELADWDRREDGSRPAADGGGTWYRAEEAELRSFDELHLRLEWPAAAFATDPDLLVFASRHAGETGPLLTGHFTGNAGPAAYGGADHELAPAAPNALAALCSAFDRHAPEGYDVGMECTHHGPTAVEVPALFAELGSDEAQWTDPAGATAVARAILDLRGVDPRRERQVVGFGGGHYVPRFERIVRETEWAVGHVLADWTLAETDELVGRDDVLRAVFERSGADRAVVDGAHPSLTRRIDALGYDVVSETWLRVVGDRPLALVDAVETELGSISEGARFGRRRTTSFEVTSLPGELRDAAEGIDAEAVRDAVVDGTVAFETRNGASRVGDRVAIPADDSLEPVIEALAAIVDRRADGVRIEPDAVVVTETVFQPDRAHELGVPEGPAFGRLANGESVTVDGRHVEPEEVHERRTARYPR